MIAPPLEVSPADIQAGRLVMRDVWRASELAISRVAAGSTGHTVLDAELPNGGWPRSSLIELMLQQHGIGEVQLLKPFLAGLSEKQRVALVQPPYLPHAMACRSWGVNAENILWLRPRSSADALWATEQILKNGSCGAVLLWQTNVRPEALRRLNLAAQTTDTWLWLMRPLSTAIEASPAPLRMSIRPANGGISIDIIKRKGPHCDKLIFVPLATMPAAQRFDKQQTIEVPIGASAASVNDLMPSLI